MTQLKDHPKPKNDAVQRLLILREAASRLVMAVDKTAESAAFDDLCDQLADTVDLAIAERGRQRLEGE
jgi:hypothetical protein